jgi:hypothetical protein
VPSAGNASYARENNVPVGLPKVPCSDARETGSHSVRILYLHGWTSVVGGINPTFFKGHGYEVIEQVSDHERSHYTPPRYPRTH